MTPAILESLETRQLMDASTAALLVDLGTVGGLAGHASAPSQVAGLVVTGPSKVHAGIPASYTIKALDGSGGVVDFDGKVAVASGDLQADLPTGIELVDGVATFSVKFGKAGVQGLDTTIIGGPALSARLDGIEVLPYVPARLVLEGPTDVVAGTPASFIVTAYDQYGNLSSPPPVDGPVQFYDSWFIYLTTREESAFNLQKSYIVTRSPGVVRDGRYHFQVEFRKAGTMTLMADALHDQPYTIPQKIVVAPAEASRVVVDGPEAVVAGTPAAFTVTAFDRFGNVATGFDGPLAVSSDDPGALLPAAVTLVDGRGTFGAVFRGAGRRSVSVADPASPVLSATSGVAVADSTNPQVTPISGIVYRDDDGDGSWDEGEPGWAGRVVFLDLDRDGTPGAGEPTATTDAGGVFSFPGFARGSAPVLLASGFDGNTPPVVSGIRSTESGAVTIGLAPAPGPVVPSPPDADPAGEADASFVRSLYRTILRRDAREAELQRWTGRLAGGVKRAQAVRKLMNSPEHRKLLSKLPASARQSTLARLRRLAASQSDRDGRGDDLAPGRTAVVASPVGKAHLQR